ncbi:MAG TPA: sulfurtransferase TusA family protein [Patescibacteria group bacterium]|nr:sulfurtransferase TusA family protein [Patescibacteria group bacterium]
MKKIDCLGEYCPVPILRIKDQLKNIPKGEPFMVVTDHSCVLQSIEDYCKKTKLEIVLDEVINGVWEITIVKL